jgi:hypothetical protein
MVMQVGERKVIEGETFKIARVVFFSVIIPWVGGWRSPRQTE